MNLERIEAMTSSIWPFGGWFSVEVWPHEAGSNIRTAELTIWLPIARLANVIGKPVLGTPLSPEWGVPSDCEPYQYKSQLYHASTSAEAIRLAWEAGEAILDDLHATCALGAGVGQGLEPGGGAGGPDLLGVR